MESVSHNDKALPDLLDATAVAVGCSDPENPGDQGITWELESYARGERLGHSLGPAGCENSSAGLKNKLLR